MTQKPRIWVTLVGGGIVFVISVLHIWVESPTTSHALESTHQSVLGDNVEQSAYSALVRPETYPYSIDSSIPNIKSKASVVYDPALKMFLYTKNGDTELPVASLMKIVTALVAEQEYALEQQVQVPSTVYTIDGSRVHLVAGDVLTVHELLAAALIPSGNDAAHTLAAVHQQGYDYFIQQMNELVSQHSLIHTKINNPVGYDFNGQYSSAKDMAALAAELLESNTLAELVKTRRMTVNGTKRSYSLVNTNRLLTSNEEVVGLKTGTSDVAGENLVFSWVHQGRTLIGVVLGSSQRFRDAETIMQWVDRTHVW